MIMRVSAAITLVSAVLAFGQWTLTDKANHITDIPSLYDFMPLGVTSELTAGREVRFLTTEPQ
jgi:hypothetical protein